MKIEELRDVLQRLGVSVADLEVRQSPRLGIYALVVIDADAKQALELWLKMLDDLRGFELPLFIDWAGRTDVTPEKLGSYIGKALAKMGRSISTTEPIDAVALLEEEWGS